MSTYAIGDIQGCYAELMELLDVIDFDPAADQLWFAGDLVNRGPDSLRVLRFVSQLENAVVVLGNHDFHLLTLTLANNPPEETFEHTMGAILEADDKEQLLEWLSQQPLIHYDASLNCVISHAGIAPSWDIETALACSREVQTILQSARCAEFLDGLFGDLPDAWDPSLTGWDRLRYIINAFTRMRFVNPQGRLILEVKGKPGQVAPDHIPWFEFDSLVLPTTTILFGHWAALEGKTSHPNAIALDTGCVWGEQLSALRLEDKQLFQVQSGS